MSMHHALLVLVPAALMAQAPQLQSFSGRLRAEAPGVERLLVECRAIEARAKAEALLPGQVAAWDEADPPAQLASYGAYREYLYAYALAARAADASGDWEQALSYFQRAQDLARTNADKVAARFPALVSYYRDLVERSRRSLAENGDYIQSLRAKPNPDAGELQQLELVQKEEESLAKNTKSAQAFEGYLETARKEADYYTRCAEREDSQIKALEKSLAEYAFANDKVKFVEGIMGSKGYLEAQYPDKAARVRFLYRMRSLDPANRRVLLEIDAQTGARLAPAETPASRRRRK
ncbi:hypothetical protein [Holophaga foetida]|uniref:hypothetical protein n=1 Tax=Holophaga foetida TaxID=35839 RepID=UPI0002472ECA|nr:hypothetical protein [Holophaga foetida]